MSATPPPFPPRGSRTHRVVPIARASDGGDSCAGAEPFALLVLGDSMAPEFVEGDVIVVEPEGRATDGAFVVAHVGGEWIFRQLAREGDGWCLRPLAPPYPTVQIADLSSVRGIVIQRSRRRESKRYGP